MGLSLVLHVLVLTSMVIGLKVLSPESQRTGGAQDGGPNEKRPAKKPGAQSLVG